MGRTSGSIRNYSEGSRHWVEYIKCMHSVGVSVETLLEYVTLFYQGASAIRARKNLLLEQREQITARISELNQVLARLNRKLDGHKERMLLYEEYLK